MNIKKAMETYLVPVMDKYNYKLTIYTPEVPSFLFENESDESLIHIDKPLLSEIRVHGRLYGCREMISIDGLNPDVAYEGYYRNRDELVGVVKSLSDVLESRLIPAMRKINQAFIRTENDMTYEAATLPEKSRLEILHRELAVNTRERAESFSKKTNMEITYSDSALKKTEEIVYDIKGNNPEKYKTNFGENQHFIVEMAAFLGELMISRKSGCIWGIIDKIMEAPVTSQSKKDLSYYENNWNSIKNPKIKSLYEEIKQIQRDVREGKIILPDDKIIPLCVIKSGEDIFSPLKAILRHWNYSPELKGYTITKTCSYFYEP